MITERIDGPVLVTHDQGVLRLVLNRPEAHNAINLEMSDAIAIAMEEAESDPQVRVVVIGAAGDRAFSAGADLKAVSRGEEVHATEGPRAKWGLGGTGRRSSKPVVAAVDGLAYGGGFEIALGADVVIASSRARFALPEVKVGLVAGAGGAVRLGRQLPRQVAMRMLLTGEPMSAERAYELGLVTELVEPGDAMRAALEVAATIAANAPLAVQATKHIALELADGVAGDEGAALRLNHDLLARIMASDDAREGTLAFSEKRAPRWSGR